MKDLEKAILVPVILIVFIGFFYFLGELFENKIKRARDEYNKNIDYVINKMDLIINKNLEVFDEEDLIKDISKACTSAGDVEGKLTLKEFLGIGGRNGQ